MKTHHDLPLSETRTTMDTSTWESRHEFSWICTAPDAWRPQSTKGAPWPEPPTLISSEIQFAGEKPWHTRREARWGDKDTAGQTSTQQSPLQNQIWLMCQHPHSKERVLVVQKGFRTTLQDVIAGKNLLQGLHHQIPELPNRTSFTPWCTLPLKWGCRAEHSAPMGTRALTCHGKAKPETSQMLRKGQGDRESLAGGAAGPVGPKEGVQAPMAGCESSWLGSPCICPWEMVRRK